MLTNIPNAEEHDDPEKDFLNYTLKSKDGSESILKKQKRTRILAKKPKIKEKFRADEATLQKVEKKIFGNSKIPKEQVIIKKVKKDDDNKNEDLSKNWVYAYDLPYDLNEEMAQNVVKKVASQYG